MLWVCAWVWMWVWVWVYVVCVDVSQTINTQKHMLDIHIHTREGFGLHQDVWQLRSQICPMLDPRSAFPTVLVWARASMHELGWVCPYACVRVCMCVGRWACGCVCEYPACVFVY